MNDAVNSPDHYVKHSIMLQPIELSNRLDSSLGQAVQYVVRRNDKNTVLENLKKARFELEWCANNLATRKGYRFTCVSKAECQVYIELFINYSKDDFFREFLMALFVSDERSFRLTVEEGIALLNREIARIESIEPIVTPNDSLAQLNRGLIQK